MVEEKKHILNIEKLKSQTPYPTDIFTEPTQDEWERVIQLFNGAGIEPDRFFAAMQRKAWNNCIDKITEEHLILNLDDEIDLTNISSELYHKENIPQRIVGDKSHKIIKVSDITDALMKAIAKTKGEKP